MSLDDLLGAAEDDLKGIKVSAAQRDAAVEAGLAEVEKERQNIRSGTAAAKVVAKLTEAFTRGARKGLLTF